MPPKENKFEKGSFGGKAYFILLAKLFSSKNVFRVVIGNFRTPRIAETGFMETHNLWNCPEGVARDPFPLVIFHNDICFWQKGQK